MPKKRKKLILIDSNALIHRAFHALPPLTTKDGKPSGAVYGVALTLLSVFEKFKPDYVVAAFDLRGKTFRHDRFKEYKAKRVKAPDELYEQIPVTRDLMKAFGIPVFEKQGFEADDIIGTISKDKKLDGEIERIIVTGDMDTLQLVDDDTKVFTLRRGIKDTFVYDEKQVRNRFSLGPDQIVDYKALRGDPSDNIPGVAGVGEKTATELLIKFKTLDGVYENVNYISPEGVQKKLKKGKKDAYLSQELAEIQTDVSVDLNLEKALADEVEGSESLVKFFEEMGFRSLVRRIGGDAKMTNGKEQMTKEVEIKIVEDKKDLEKVIKKIKKEKKLSYCLLTDSDKFYDARFLGLGIYVSGGESYFVSNAYMRYLQNVFKDAKIEKVGFNVKLDWQVMGSADDFQVPPSFAPLSGATEGRPTPSFAKGGKNKKSLHDITSWHDVQIMAYLLGLNADSLEKLILNEFGEELKYAGASLGQTNLLAETDDMKKKDVAERAMWVGKLGEIYKRKIGLEDPTSLRQAGATKGANAKEKKDARILGRLYQMLEIPLIPILARMEMAGVKVDKTILKKVSDLAKKEIETLEQKIYKLAGEEFNINSPSQVAPILYEKLKIPTTEIKRGKTGFSTDADQLRKVRDVHPIVPLIEEYREYFKIKSTYADALPNLVHNDGRIHTYFNQAVAATGRLSSSDPNMQNIPKRGRLADLIRESFVADKNKILVSADYSQIDLRVAAHLSNDAKMIEAFEKGKDIHSATAAWVNEIPESKIDKKKRNEAKSLNFGILYGMGLYGFMRDSGVSGERAKYFIDHYKKTFSGLTEFIEQTKKEARKKGYVETELGRRRYIPNIKASNVMLRNAAERMAINLPVQGLAADIMKLAMIAVTNYTTSLKLRSAGESNTNIRKKSDDIKLILQIHDELIFEVNEKIADKFMKDVKKVMEKVYKLKVPLTVDVTKGKNWEEL